MFAGPYPSKDSLPMPLPSLFVTITSDVTCHFPSRGRVRKPLAYYRDIKLFQLPQHNINASQPSIQHLWVEKRRWQTR
jgi:hypothetical protein